MRLLFSLMLQEKQNDVTGFETKKKDETSYLNQFLNNVDL